MNQPDSDNLPVHQQQSVRDVTVSGDENPVAVVSAAGNAAIDQSRHIIYNYYYYREESSLAPVESAAQADTLPCPYRGLFHFGPDNAEFFFGRDVFVTELVQAVQFGRQTVVTELVQAVQTLAFIPVLGASGSGKSSVVFAGLVPELQRAGHWLFTHFRPGEDPFHALSLALVPLYQPEQDATDQIAQARKLANFLRNGEVSLKDVVAQIQQHHPQHRILLIADQFEELYTLCTEDSTRNQFLDCLLANLSAVQATPPLLVLVATMRADFLGNALSYRPFADILQTGDIKLGAMNRDELQAVIEQPAAKLGVTFEAGLVQRILQDVESEPGNLPLLEFALTELWQRRTGKQLTHEAYTAIGEVQGALARHADASYCQLTPTEQALLRQLMMELVQLGQDQEVTRKRAGWEQLRAISDAPEQVDRVVGKLVKQRLIVTNEKAVEVAHEALLTQWPLLKQLIQENRQAIRLRNQLTNDCQEWQDQQQSKDYLLSLGRLAVFEEWIKRDQPRLPKVETEYLQYSRENHDLEANEKLEQERKLREIAEARANAEEEARQKADEAVIAESETRKATEKALTEEQKRLKSEQQRTRFAIVAGVLAVTSLGLGLFSQARLAQESQQKALISGVLIGKAETLLSVHKQLEALEASIETLSELREIGREDSSDLQRIQTVFLNVKERDRIQAHAGGAYGLSFSPDGKTIVSGGEDGSIRIWDLAKNKVSAPIKKHNDIIRSIRFSSDGQLFASASIDKTVKVWDIKGNLIHSFNYGDYVYDVRFSKSNQKLAASGLNRGVIIWDLKTRRIFRILKDSGHTDQVLGIAFSPNNESLLVTTGTERKFNIAFWDIKEKVPKPTFIDTSQDIVQSHLGTTFSVDFSPQGDMVVSCDDNGNIYLRNSKGELIGRAVDRDHSFYYVTFSTDGKLIATVESSTNIKIWEIDELLKEWRRSKASLKKPKELLDGNSGAVTRISFRRPSNDISGSILEMFLASAEEGGMIRIWKINQYKENILTHPKDSDILLTEGCAILKNYLTRDVQSHRNLFKICKRYIGNIKS
ncbi:MAG: hypothetical protein KME16_15080 [Scytolyngbya sp. HA4215-MV1]|jgi:WD40 repeat protein|nr:hypothetical protein [Scytolyngbya sp. HA4215-MV1]